jgi:hypothetical protein
MIVEGCEAGKLTRGAQLKLLRYLVIPKLGNGRETVSGGVAKAVLRCIDDRAGHSSVCKCKLETLAKESCFGRNTTGRAIRLLTEAGYLSGSMKMGQGQRLILRVNWQAVSDSSEELEEDVSGSSADISGSSADISGSSADISGSSEELPSEAPLKRHNKRPVKRERAAPFTPPSLDDVQAYWADQALRGDPEQFYDHFTSNGWKVSGRSPMKDWQASARNWSRKEPQFTSKPKTFDQQRSENSAAGIQSWLARGRGNAAEGPAIRGLINGSQQCRG